MSVFKKPSIEGRHSLQGAVPPPIAAVSTPLGTGAIAIVRMSGAGCIELAKKLFFVSGKPAVFKPRVLTLGRFCFEGFSEQCLCAIFRSPNSYTGEDMAEFQIHGGTVVTNAVLAALISSGARLAENGEFTRRAVLNGKMSLAAAEGTLALINSNSYAALNAARALQSEAMTDTIGGYASEINDCIAAIEVALDYPEEDIEFETLGNIKERIEKISCEAKRLLLTRPTAVFASDGINIAIIGKPNVGKSSLLNALLGQERAIVSDIAGTTRDTLSERVEYKGIAFNFVDTAGLREHTVDSIEKLGMERTRKAIAAADVVLLLTAAGEEPDEELLKTAKDKPVINVVTKSDSIQNLKEETGKTGNIIYTSAKTGYNISRLKQAVFDLVIDQNVLSGGIMLSTARHYDCVKRACESLERAIKTDELNFAALDLRDALSALYELTGQNVSDEIVNKIFQSFCLGK